NKPPEEPYIPWNVHPEKNLPRAITVHTDTLLSKEFTRPIKTNLGFFLARVQEIKLIKEVSFREAYAKLVYLATRDKLLGMDSVIAAKSLQYYRDHPEEFKISETLGLTAWLLPNQPDERSGVILSVSPTRLGKDTLAYPSLKLSSIWLSSNLQKHLTRLLNSLPIKEGGGNSNPVFGPIKAEYGQWYFRIDSIQKAGGIESYADVKQAIIHRLTSPAIEPDSFAMTPAKEKVLRNLGMAQILKSKILSKWISLPSQEIVRIIQSRAEDTLGFSKKSDLEYQVESARRNLAISQEDSIRKDAKTLLKMYSINYPKLFSK